ncbi:MAG: recombinase family protein [Symplocastrum torsivum CPER-KK1]|jgi:DNA invertase Pin-like site-specific DNA recombinase|uniref:Recombinase family protein n=1 Tax=Symplocastrum torsivum CPER-KK1 TaxID=450513 RepID=A0A951PT92_9CYAN|nr:recombinase family protein [Symplocastrum torsivum CPER-KK1]
MGKICGYARVSTHEQAFDHNAFKQQIHRIEQFGVDKIYQDIESGANPDRPGFNDLLSSVAQGEVDVIVATRWDRLTREPLVYYKIKELLRSSNIKLTLLDQGEVDLNSASGELSADLQATIAQHERRMLRERIQRGFEYRRGNKVAWTRAPWGYVIEDDKYVLDTEPVICLLQDRPQDYLALYNEPNTSTKLIGISKSQIARESVEVFLQLRRTRPVLTHLYLKYGVERKKKGVAKSGDSEAQEIFKKSNKETNLVLSKQVLFWASGANFKVWLENPVLRGHTAYKKFQRKGGKKDPNSWEVHYDTHPDSRLITDEEFQEIQAILKSNSRMIGTPGLAFYLTGLVVCDECGHKCVLKHSADYRYYGCRNSTIGCSNRKCIRTEKLDEAIIHQLFHLAHELSTRTNECKEDLLEASKLTLLKQQLEGLDKLLEISPTPHLKQAKYGLIKEIEGQSLQVEQKKFVQETAQQMISRPEAKKKSFWYTLNLKEREIIYDKFVSKVSILNGEVVSVDLTI